MKQNTCFKGEGGSCIDLLITNSKFSFIFSIEPKKFIYRNFKQFNSDQFKLDICNSMSAIRTHAASENKDKHDKHG